MRKVQEKMMYLVPLLFLMVGLVIMGDGFVKLCELNIAGQWESTTGLIISIDVEVSIMNYPGVILKTYTPIATYNYTVEGQHYQSNNIWEETNHFDTCEEAEAFLAASFTVNSTTPVYYKKDNPAYSVLITDKDYTNTILLTLFGAMIAGLCSGIIVYFYYEEKKSTNPNTSRLNH